MVAEKSGNLSELIKYAKERVEEEGRIQEPQTRYYPAHERSSEFSHKRNDEKLQDSYYSPEVTFDLTL